MGTGAGAGTGTGAGAEAFSVLEDARNPPIEVPDVAANRLVPRHPHRQLPPLVVTNLVMSTAHDYLHECPLASSRLDTAEKRPRDQLPHASRERLSHEAVSNQTLELVCVLLRRGTGGSIDGPRKVVGGLISRTLGKSELRTVDVMQGGAPSLLPESGDLDHPTLLTPRRMPRGHRATAGAE
ncbi:hypothetical protein NMY22_g18200 [Coprinellus aureogranulatus]|nr:hypothetical protein NMY22_g18200 [Coprinellus aureogranulatus]